MGFKESFLEDLKTTFFNTEEMAGIHTIDGQEVTLVLQDASLEPWAFKGNRRARLIPKESSVNESAYLK